MRRIALFASIALTIATPALAEKVTHASLPKAQMPLCEIWASTEAPNVPAMLAHEQAHCWGWVHPVHGSPLLAKTKGERDAYRAYSPPMRYRMLGEYPNAVIYFLTEKEAAKECGSWGCASGGLLPD